MDDEANGWPRQAPTSPIPFVPRFFTPRMGSFWAQRSSTLIVCGPPIDQVSKKHEPPRQYLVYDHTTESIKERVQQVGATVDVANGENNFSVCIDVGRTPFRYVNSDGFLHY